MNRATHLFLISILCVYLTSNAQSLEFNVGLNAINFTHEKGHRDDLLQNIVTTNFYDFKPVISVGYINKKNIEYNFSYGYFYNKGKSYNKIYIETFQETYEDITKRLSKSHYIKLGVGKRFTFLKFLSTSFIYLPIEYNCYKKYDYSTKVYDKSNVLLGTIHKVDMQAKSTNFGLYLAQTLYYPIFKNLYIGAELNIGVNVYLQSGIRDYDEIQTDKDGNLISQFKHSYIVKDITYVTLDMMPMLSLKYKIRMKERKRVQ